MKKWCAMWFLLWAGCIYLEGQTNRDMRIYTYTIQKEDLLRKDTADRGYRVKWRYVVDIDVSFIPEGSWVDVRWNFWNNFAGNPTSVVHLASIFGDLMQVFLYIDDESPVGRQLLIYYQPTVVENGPEER